MNRKELIGRVSERMFENNMKKPVSLPKHAFIITDSEGASSRFTVKPSNKMVRYTVDDVAAVVDTCVEVIKEAIAKGEQVAYMGFGVLALKYWKPRSTPIPCGDRGFVDAPQHWYPSFKPGVGLKRCAKLYELSMRDRVPVNLPEPDVEDSEDGEDDAD